MKKLTMNIDDLRVESFSTLHADAATDRGTVRANEWVLTPKCVVTGGVNSCWCTERTCP